MPAAGPRSGGTFTSDTGSGGTLAWTDPGNAISSNNVYAVVGNFDPAVSHYLKATNFGFTDADIPPGSVIDGIVVDWEKRKNDGNATVNDHRVRIVKGGTVGATDKAAVGEWMISDAYRSYGGAADLWGLTWTDADIKATGFGGALSANIQGWLIYWAYGYIDHVRITVYYTPVVAGHGMSSQIINFLFTLAAPLAHWLGFWKAVRSSVLVIHA